MKANFWRVFWGLILIVVGCLFMLDSFGYIYFDLWDTIVDLWPLVLIAVGLAIIISRGKKSVVTYSGGESGVSRFIGDIRIEVPPKDINGSRVSNFIGDIDITITGTEMNEGENKLLISSFIGDTTITVPEDLPFMVEQSSFFGDFKIDGAATSCANTVKGGYKSVNYNESPNKLLIRSNVFIGDLKVFIR